MARFCYYVNIPGMIAIRTNVKKFRWGFGKCSVPTDEKEYDRCMFKVNLDKRRDFEVFKDIDTEEFCNSFRHFRLSPDSGSLMFEKKVGKALKLRFFLSIRERQVDMIVGESYLRFLKAKIMYYHPVSYILFDAVSELMLLNGFTTLYCSSARLKNGKTVLCMAPPNTGKSLTVLQLQNKYGAEIIAEDMAITDGNTVWGSKDTDLYRNYHDKDILAVEKKDTPIFSKADSLFILQKGSGNDKEVGDLLSKCLLINRYSLGYYYSPSLRAINYYNPSISTAMASENEQSIFSKLIKNTDCHLLSSRNSLEFAEMINSICCDN